MRSSRRTAPIRQRSPRQSQPRLSPIRLSRQTSWRLQRRTGDSGISRSGSVHCAVDLQGAWKHGWCKCGVECRSKCAARLPGSVRRLHWHRVKAPVAVLLERVRREPAKVLEAVRAPVVRAVAAAVARAAPVVSASAARAAAAVAAAAVSLAPTNLDVIVSRLC